MQTLSYGLSRDDETATLVLQDPFRIGRPLGRGSLGMVCEATHTRLPGRLAVKILSRGLAGDRDAVARFYREAELLAQLRHPNLVQILDFNSTPDGLPYYVMEYLDGTDLARRLETGDPMLPGWTVHIVDQVASALAAAHAHGLAHRQLTPAHIFLTRVEGQNDEFVKVLELGVDKPRAVDRTAVPRYMTPEQALGQSERVDGRTDQFALAAITYAMLTGRHAFAGDDPAAVLYQVVHEQPPPLSRFLSWDVSRVQGVISRGLAKDQDMRYDSILDFARALEGAVFHVGTVFAAVAPAVGPDTTPRSLTPSPMPAAALPGGPHPEDGGQPLDAPLRLPPVPSFPPHPASRRAIGSAKRRAVLLEGDAVESVPDVEPVRTTRASGSEVYDWELPSTIDRVPISPGRAVALAGIAAVLCGVLFAKGWHREVAGDANFLRDNLVAYLRPPAPMPQPPAAPSNAPHAAAPVRAVPAPEPEAAPAAPAPAAPAPTPAPASEAAPAVRAEEEPPARKAAGSSSRSRSAGRSSETRRLNMELSAPRPEPPPSPSASPSPTVAPQAAPAPSGKSSGFSIAPPSTQGMPDDIMPMGADGTPASAGGSEEKAARAPRP